MTTKNLYASKCIFGLDIGTRSIVGTVGTMRQDKFVVLAQKSVEHETRAMLDGQIHDIARVAETIKRVKESLEKDLDMKLEEVCIAAAGRVLRTLTIHTELDFDDDTTITDEEIYALNSKGVEQAYAKFLEEEKSDVKFYCVGYSIIRYYLNGYQINKLNDHRAKSIGADLIATFLPNDVVDGLYKAVELAGLTVVNLTLEPIAAILVAIPEQFRMLNIALVDVGAGTSDISITKDGSITAYGMIPFAGDGITEAIARHCLVDFNTAEKIKIDYTNGKDIAFEDIMGLPQTMNNSELDEVVGPVVENMTKQIADKIMELNGGKTVSAVFVVGGGGKITYYTNRLSEHLGIAKERVALRGKEVMGQIIFEDDTIEKDSLLVTPIGICLSFFENNNSFVYVQFNGEHVKLYDNGKLAVIDAVMNANFDSDDLFPKRGPELEFTVNGKTRIVRGSIGEAAVIYVNGEIADIHYPIHENDIIHVNKATAGEPAKQIVGKLPEFSSTFEIEVNGKKVVLPKFPTVNGELQDASYEIKPHDDIEMLNYHTVEQMLEFMDLPLQDNQVVYVNGKAADKNTKIYENFNVDIKFGVADASEEPDYDSLPEEEEESAVTTGEIKSEAAQAADTSQTEMTEEAPQFIPNRDMMVIVNGRPIMLKGKPQYIFVDVFDYIDFDLSRPQGKGIVTRVNKEQAQYLDLIHDGDVIEIYWDK